MINDFYRNVCLEILISTFNLISKVRLQNHNLIARKHFEYVDLIRYQENKNSNKKIKCKNVLLKKGWEKILI